VEQRVGQRLEAERLLEGDDQADEALLVSPEQRPRLRHARRQEGERASPQLGAGEGLALLEARRRRRDDREERRAHRGPPSRQITKVTLWKKLGV
jgi:hypothetical protein